MPVFKAAQLHAMSINPPIVNQKSGVQVVARATTIRRALEEETVSLSHGQIAQRVNLSRSTVQRIVAALQVAKLVISATPNGWVRLGNSILRLAASVRSDFLVVARPILAWLSDELPETVDLAMVRKDHLIFIDQVIGSERLRAVSAVGEVFPLSCTANGKAYLAQLSDAAVEALVGRTYTARTPKSLTRLDALLEELATVRRTGVAYLARSTRSASAPPVSPRMIRSAIRSPYRSRCRASASPTGSLPPSVPWRSK